jgi:RimJ/RimL family protein N-acetyltransferase
MLDDGKEVFLKDGSRVLISKYKVEDFEKLVEMYASLDKEALKWGLPPYDRERITRWIQDLENNIILVARLHDKIIGHCGVHIVLHHIQYKGKSDFGIYVHQDYQDKGLGTIMTSMAISLARERGLHRIELSVVADNKKAIHVYEKVGFKIEGIQKEAYYGEEGKYHDITIMGLLL